jgi:DNA-binding NtrC family response regulator
LKNDKFKSKGNKDKMKFKLLIIDDEDIVCYGLSQILKDKGYSVDSAMDVTKALHMIKETEYDLILLDINLPEKSGIELLSDIKSISSECLVIMITAYDDVSLAVDAIKSGAYDYFIKSSEYDELLIKLRRPWK